jgi:YCII-related domain
LKVPFDETQRREPTTNYVIAYKAGKPPASQEAGKAQMAKWQVWIDGLGEAVINPGTPLGAAKTVTAEGVSDLAERDRWTGYTIVKADNMDAALKMTATCPYLQVGALEVYEVIQM